MRTRYLALSLLAQTVCLSLCACQPKQEAGGGVPPAASLEEPAGSASSSPEEVSRARMPELSVSGLPGADRLTDGDPATAVALDGTAELSVALPEKQWINYIEIDCGGEISAVVMAGDQVIYDGGDGDSVFLRFDDINTDALSVRLSGKASVSEMVCGRSRVSAPVYAYVPASTPPAALENRLDQRLGRVTVITGLAWDESGKVVEIDDNLEPLYETLRKASGPEIYATVYPQSGLIRSGRAGGTVDTPEKRAALAANLRRYARENGLNGIDFDWEAPANDKEWKDYSDLLALAADTFGEGVGLSVALYPEQVSKLTPEAVAAVDALNLMAYDQFDGQGRHATFRAALDAVPAALEAGFSAGQIVLGIPAYGRPTDAAPLWPLYAEQELAYQQNMTDGIYFNSRQMARDKAGYASVKKLGGVFLYHLTGDYPASHPMSLLGAMD